MNETLCDSPAISQLTIHSARSTAPVNARFTNSPVETGTDPVIAAFEILPLPLPLPAP